jgi:SAM-dependent methyltransferase
MSEPSPWITRFIGGCGAPGALVLDVACGSGRHIALARRYDYHVTGLDRRIDGATETFANDPGVTLIESDLEDGAPFPVPPASFDGVIVTNYLWRPLLPAIVAAVKPSGVLIYETFRLGNERFGKPSNPEFLLQPGELLDSVGSRLQVIAFEEATLAAPPRVIQHICAVGPEHPWIAAPPAL